MVHASWPKTSQADKQTHSTVMGLLHAQQVEKGKVEGVVRISERVVPGDRREDQERSRTQSGPHSGRCRMRSVARCWAIDEKMDGDVGGGEDTVEAKVYSLMI